MCWWKPALTVAEFAQYLGSHALPGAIVRPAAIAQFCVKTEFAFLVQMANKMV